MKLRDWLICAAILAVLFAVSTRQEDPDAFSLWSGYEAQQGEVYVYHDQQTRTVPDPEVKEYLLDLCRQAELYRPLQPSLDIWERGISGSIRLETGDTWYCFYLGETEKQLALDYIHRDAPIVSVSRYQRNEQDMWELRSSWYCTLPPAEFAALCQAVLTYSGGEVIREEGVA